MNSTTLKLPISLEQVASLIKRMPPQQRQHLIALVPELVDDAIQQKKMMEIANQVVEEFKQELLEVCADQPISPDEPFLGGFTLGQFLNLPELERAKLWDQWSALDMNELEELEVHPDAMPA